MRPKEFFGTGGLSWRIGGLKYLGVYLGNDLTVEKNWADSEFHFI